MSNITGTELEAGSPLDGVAPSLAGTDLPGANNLAAGDEDRSAGKDQEHVSEVVMNFGLSAAAAKGEGGIVLRVLAERLAGHTVAVTGQLAQIFRTLQQDGGGPVVDGQRWLLFAVIGVARIQLLA